VKGAEFVVIGCGVAGAWTALMLAEAGAGRVVVLDKAHPGAGASTKGQGLIRVHHANQFEMDLAFQSRRYYREWDETVGRGSCGWRETGLMWIVAPDNVTRLRENAEIQRRIGCAADVLEPPEITERWSSLSSTGIGAAVYEPEGGTAIGALAIDGLVSRLLAEGVEVLSHTAVSRILHDGSRVTGVESASGSIGADRVVLAAGAWSSALARTAGVELPIDPTRATLGTAYYPPSLEPAVAIFDEVFDCSFSPKAGGSWSTVSVRDDGFLASADPDDLRDPDVDAALAGLGLVANRIPAMRDAVLGSRWAAADGVTPDGRPIIGEHPELPGLFIHAGGNFKGFKMAPIAARGLVSQMLSTHDVGVDIGPYWPGRFAADGPAAPWQDSQYAHSRWT
jgi:glycine/D-amino acid oxidase-like deaminating enzyme